MSKKAKPTPLTKLLKAWTGASPEERQAFLDLVTAEVRAKGEMARSVVAKPPASLAPDPVTADQETLIANGRYLLPSTIARVEAVMRTRNLVPTSVMAELGFSPRDTSLTRALAMKAALRLSVIAELALWLRANEAAATRQG
jgi:molybdenum cofactor biosynthesis enzyme